MTKEMIGCIIDIWYILLLVVLLLTWENAFWYEESFVQIARIYVIGWGHESAVYSYLQKQLLNGPHHILICIPIFVRAFITISS